jgi:general secretion pathway protein D
MGSGRLVFGICLYLSVSVSGCTLTAVGDAGTEPPDGLDRVRAIDLSPRQLQGGGGSGSEASTRTRIYYGADGSTQAYDEQGRGPGPAGPGPAGPGPAGQGRAGSLGGAEDSAEGVALDFENTPVSAVAKVVLGDLLHIGYVIDPRVQGTISLSSSRKLPKADLLFVLETALRSANAVLVRDRAGYRIVPSEDAIGTGPTEAREGAAAAGYGVTAIPLRHVSVAAISKLVDGFAAKAGSVRGDPAANLLVVTGNAAERQSVLDTVKSFDADWMRGQSVGIYPVHNTTPEPLIGELEKILDSGENGLGQGLVKVQPIGRLNAILVVAKKPALLQRTGTWISRLDASSLAATGVKVYKVRYGEARQIARLLSEMFVGAGRGGTGQDATDALAPGSGASGAASQDRLSGGTGAQGQAGQGGFGQSGFGQGGFGQSGSAGTQGGQSGFGQGGFGQGGLGAQQGGGDQQPFGALRPATAQEGAATGAAGGTAGGAGQALLPGVRILADTVNNAVLIYASPSGYKIIERALNQLDRPQAQVAIDLTIAEVTLNDRLNYGVQFFLGSSNLGLGVDHGSVINTAVGDPLAQSVPGFNLVFGNRLSPRVVIDALHRFTDVKILSNPSLVVVNNQVATLQVGDQVPVQTGNATVLNATTSTSNTIVNTVDYRNTGIILRVKPRINFNGNVALDVEQEISNVAQTGTQNTLTPTFSQRRVKSAIQVANGQTVLLAGLIGNTQSRARDGIPLLDQLPFVGDAFSTANDKRIQRTELIIFIRPQIIRDGVDASYVAEELRAKMRGDKVGSLRPLGAVQPDPPPALMR